jgi:hypothetical protein
VNELVKVRKKKVIKRKKKRFKKHLEEVNSKSMDFTTMFGYK